MNWENIIVTAINMLGVGGVFTAILFYSENKRAKHLANEATAAQQQKELYDELRADNATLKDNNTKKDTIIEELRKEREVWRGKYYDMKAQKAVLTVMKCDRANCSNRRPPFGVRRSDNIETALYEENENNGNGKREQTRSNND